MSIYFALMNSIIEEEWLTGEKPEELLVTFETYSALREDLFKMGWSVDPDSGDFKVLGVLIKVAEPPDELRALLNQKRDTPQ